MKWTDVKDAILKKLFLNEEEAEEQDYLAKFGYLANECLNLIANGVKPRIATFEVETTECNQEVEMPDDFISFADLVNYRGCEADPDIVYVTDRIIRLPKKGKYKIFYNATWEIVEDDFASDDELKIDVSVLHCVPSYVASQLLSQDDVQRSVRLQNEFELMLSRLDTNIMNQENHFRSVGGWY